MSTTSPAKVYNPTFDLLRVGAAIGIILIHVSWWYAYSSPVWTFLWYLSTAINSLSRRCIPIFFMLSGILLLDTNKQDEDIGSFYSKKILRLAVPYILWNAIYYLIRRSRSQTGMIWWAKTFMIQLLSQGVYPYHLWFLSALIGMYLLVPFLRVLLRHISSKQLLFLNLWFIVFSGINTWIWVNNQYGERWYDQVGFTPALYTWLTWYMILWYSLRNYRTVIDAIAKRYIVAGYLVLAWIIGYLTWLVSHVKGVNRDIMYENWHLWVIVMSMVVLALAKSYQGQIAQFFVWVRASWLRYAASLTFGVYIIHLLMIKWFASHVVIDRFFGGHLSLMHYVVCVVGVLLCSFGLTAVIHKIPYGDKLLPRS